jgi:hypothetical protein
VVRELATRSAGGAGGLMDHRGNLAAAVALALMLPLMLALALILALACGPGLECFWGAATLMS